MIRPNWQELCRLDESIQNRFFIAVTNLLCATGLPGAAEINIDSCLQVIDQWADAVRQETARLRYLFERQPASYHNSEAHFRMMVLVTVLQRDFGVHYSPRFNAMPDSEFFSKSEHLFIHGVLQSREGTCSSLPPTFAAVGRRLGYPLKLVTTAEHAFLRWDGPTGERFNIECTSHGLVSHSDEHYLQWPQPLSKEQVRRYGALQSLSPRKELAVFVGNRGHVLLEQKGFLQACIAYAHCCELDPENWSWSQSLVGTMNRWRTELRSLMMIGFPPMTILFPPRGFPNIPLDLERGICHEVAKDKLLHDEELNEKWWQPLRRDPAHSPRDLPAHITVRFPQKRGETLDFIFAKKLPDGYDPKKTQPA